MTLAEFREVFVFLLTDGEDAIVDVLEFVDTGLGMVGFRIRMAVTGGGTAALLAGVEGAKGSSFARGSGVGTVG